MFGTVSTITNDSTDPRLLTFAQLIMFLSVVFIGKGNPPYNSVTQQNTLLLPTLRPQKTNQGSISNLIPFLMKILDSLV